jgi:hypothetical protein
MEAAFGWKDALSIISKHLHSLNFWCNESLISCFSFTYICSKFVFEIEKVNLHHFIYLPLGLWPGF